MNREMPGLDMSLMLRRLDVKQLEKIADRIPHPDEPDFAPNHPLFRGFVRAELIDRYVRHYEAWPVAELVPVMYAAGFAQTVNPTAYRRRRLWDSTRADAILRILCRDASFSVEVAAIIRKHRSDDPHSPDNARAYWKAVAQTARRLLVTEAAQLTEEGMRNAG